MNSIELSELIYPEIANDTDYEAMYPKRNLPEGAKVTRLEQQKLDFHYRVYDGYKALCDKYPERIVRIDASKTIDEIKGDIYSKLETLETL